MQIEQRYVLVPVEPTEAMVEAGIAQANDCTDNFTAAAACTAEHVYRAMIAARPAVGEDVVERVARAISDYTFATIHGSTDCNEWEDMTATDRFVYRNAAHAAIAAMGSDMGKGGEG